VEKTSDKIIWQTMRLAIKIMNFFYIWHNNLLVSPQIGMQPACTAFWRAYAKKIRIWDKKWLM
jgi:hypothetical protein